MGCPGTKLENIRIETSGGSSWPVWWKARLQLIQEFRHCCSFGSNQINFNVIKTVKVKESTPSGLTVTSFGYLPKFCSWAVKRNKILPKKKPTVFYLNDLIEYVMCYVNREGFIFISREKKIYGAKLFVCCRHIYFQVTASAEHSSPSFVYFLLLLRIIWM